MKTINVAIWGPFVACGLVLSCCMHIFFTLFFVFSLYLPYNSHYLYHLIQLLYKVIRLSILPLRSSLKYIRNASWNIFRRSSLATTSGYSSGEASGEATPKLREITMEFHDDKMEFYDKLKFQDDRMEFQDDGLELDDNGRQETSRVATPFPSFIADVSEEPSELNSSGDSSSTSYQTVLDECCSYVSYVWQYSRKFFQRKSQSSDDDDSSMSPTSCQTYIYEYTSAEYENLQPPPTFFQKTASAFKQVMGPLLKIIKLILSAPPFSFAVKKLTAIFRAKQNALKVKWNSYLRRIQNALYIGKLQNGWQRFVGTIKTLSRRLQDDYYRTKAQVEQEATCPDANNINEKEINGIAKETRELSMSSEDSVDSDFVTPEESPDEDEWQEATSQHDYNLSSKEDNGSDARVKPSSLSFRKRHYIVEGVEYFGKWFWNHIANVLYLLNSPTIRQSLAKIKRMLLTYLAYPSRLGLKLSLKKRNESRASYFGIYKHKKGKQFTLRKNSSSSDEWTYLTPSASPNKTTQLVSISYCKDPPCKSYAKSNDGTNLDSSFETTTNTSSSDDATEQ